MARSKMALTKDLKTGPRLSPEAGADVKPILLRVNPEAHKALKHLATDDDRTVTSLMIEALNDYLEKRGQKRLATERTRKRG
jgi:hypothetical protein